MAVVTALNVFSMSANGDILAGPQLAICGIKLVETAGAAVHVRLRQDGVVGGKVVYEGKAAANGVDWCDIKLAGTSALYLEVVAGAGNLYLYSE